MRGLRDDKVLRSYEYDARNRLTHVWRGNFAELERQVTHDALGRVASVFAKEYEAVIHFGYNMHGHVTYISDDKGNAVQFDYPASGLAARGMR